MSHFYSTKNKNLSFSLKEAVLKGLAPDGGLFMPDTIPLIDSKFLANIASYSFQEIAFEVAKTLLSEVPEQDLKQIVNSSITFNAPLVQLDEQLFALELFHGPTLSFKDFGARFMAQMMAYLHRNESQNLNILAATSGDTGSAVAQGFLNVPGIKVWILYPKGQVSMLQEKQLTTVGHNVQAIEVEGSFDDCQALVKQAFSDQDLPHITSANSINIARLIPQSFYYFYAYAQAKQGPICISVPSGNFGNLTAGLIAKKMGLPVSKFVASTNINDSVPKFLQTGIFTPHPSHQTISNAMDVGNPSNFARILDLYQNNLENIRKDILGASFDDHQTKLAIKEIYRKYHYISDPHGAVAYLGLKKHSLGTGIFLETAHPAKFLDTVEPLIEEKIAIPENLQKVIDKPKQVVTIFKKYQSLKEILLTK